MANHNRCYPTYNSIYLLLHLSVWIILFHENATGYPNQGLTKDHMPVSNDFFFMADQPGSGEGPNPMNKMDGAGGDDEDFLPDDDANNSGSGSGEKPSSLSHDGRNSYNNDNNEDNINDDNDEDEDSVEGGNGSGSGSGERPLADSAFMTGYDGRLTKTREDILLRLSRRRESRHHHDDDALMQSQMSKPVECTPEYSEIPFHTMCLKDDVRAVQHGVSSEDKRLIVDLHNQLRQFVEPPATDMTAMVWDERIAAIAQKWAKQCTTKHDSHGRNLPAYGADIGQNTAGGFYSWRSAILSWYNQGVHYPYELEPESSLVWDDLPNVKPYLQMVRNTSSRVGCGWAKCRDTEYDEYFVCNYAHGAPIRGYPYTVGDRCGACGDTCKDGLCDCGGKLCMNGGTLDLSRCICQCASPYTGDVCEQLEL